MSRPGLDTRIKTVVATFAPTRFEDLNADGWSAVGWRGTWQALWTVDDPTSPYHGERLWWPLDADRWVGIVPEEDLLDCEPATTG